LRKHLASCGLCTLLAQRLQEFHSISEAPAAPGSAEWDRLEPAIDERFRQHLRDQETAKTNFRRRLTFWLSQPALAWCVALLLAYPAWRGVTRPAADSPTAHDRAASAQFLDLNATRDGSTAALRGTALRPGTPLVLGFFAAVQPGRTYKVSLAGRSGVPVFRDVPVQPNDDKGNFFVECESSGLGSGSYLLTLSSSAGDAPPRQFEFTIR
jgi:hypothetical protein